MKEITKKFIPVLLALALFSGMVFSIVPAINASESTFYYVYGDADLSSKIDTENKTITESGVNITDVTLVLRHIVRLDELTGNNIIAADADEDNQISIKDASSILRFIVKLPTDDKTGTLGIFNPTNPTVPTDEDATADMSVPEETLEETDAPTTYVEVTTEEPTTYIPTTYITTEESTTEVPTTETPTTEAPVTTVGISEDEAFAIRVVELVNEERAKEGIAPLIGDYGPLLAAAKVRAAELNELFSHTRPDGRTCFTALDDQGISRNGAGENIATGQKTPEAVVTAWMGSEGHRKNIMNENFTHIGVAKNGGMWVQMFVKLR